MTRPGRRLRPRCETLEGRIAATSGLALTPGPDFLADTGATTPRLTLASFVVTDPTTPPGDQRRALVVWGDGSSTKQVVPVPRPDGSFAILGAHLYDRPGDYRVSVTVAVPGDPATQDSVALASHVTGDPAPPPVVTPAPAPEAPPVPALAVEGLSLVLRPGRPLNGTVATVHVQRPGGVDPAGALATIAWGDGKTSAGRVAPAADGTWSISGRHRYRKRASYQLTVTLNSSAGQFTGTSQVQPPPRRRPR